MKTAKAVVETILVQFTTEFVSKISGIIVNRQVILSEVK